MILQVVSPQFVDQAWRDGAFKLADACDRAGGEVTADQLKMMLARGEKQLVALRDDDRFKGWAVIQFDQYPNMRALFIYSLYAPGVTKQFAELLMEVARQQGCSAIRAACDEANQRLWEMKLGAKKVYSVMEHPV